MKTITIEEAVAGLDRWMERALAGEEIQIRKGDAVAELFNQTGRRRGSRFDCMIAATTIGAQAQVATVNQSDFQVFVPHGLTLATA